MWSWGLHEEDDIMKKLVANMGLDNLYEEMNMFFMEVASTSTPIGTTFVTYPIVLPLKLQ
jgi:hypothetical protein